ncbi:DUF4019 domain-containing protein [Nitrosospira sp. Is2]|uniref:DUF4019 domain-containing protein n=1 Tax=Nitrosospira sp. Is2 TaxID=3080532 RepID=UPI0029540007|nr:DUF4019 domain-containing protein [Nitrosospira sp. Is2]WON75237.1 DUF4019 domain-containing protein [Nitrosospira sp. Is2]
MPKASRISGTLDINVLLSFVFGVVFITAILIFAVWIKDPSAFQLWTFITVLALSAGGVGAVIPGILNVDLPYVKAGGALALFTMVFLMKPQIIETIDKIVPPAVSPTAAIEAYLSKVDAKKIDEAWGLLDEEAKLGVARDRQAYRDVYASGRDVLGKVLERDDIGVQEYQSPPGYPVGIYRIVTFRTKFESGECHQESVALRAIDGKRWHVYLHSIVPTPIPCLKN